MTHPLTRLFVNNMHWDATPGEIKASLSQAAGADVIGVGCPKNPETGRRRKYVFLIVRTDDLAKFMALDHAEFEGRFLRVSKANNQEFKDYRKIEKVSLARHQEAFRPLTDEDKRQIESMVAQENAEEGADVTEGLPEAPEEPVETPASPDEA